MSYFNQPKKIDPNDDEQKENHRRSNPIISDKTESKKLTNETNIIKRRSRTKQEKLPDNNFLSSIQVEKTSLILFDEVCLFLFK
jgi:hypothetical protein